MTVSQQVQTELGRNGIYLRSHGYMIIWVDDNNYIDTEPTLHNLWIDTNARDFSNAAAIKLRMNKDGTYSTLGRFIEVNVFDYFNHISSNDLWHKESIEIGLPSLLDSDAVKSRLPHANTLVILLEDYNDFVRESSSETFKKFVDEEGSNNEVIFIVNESYIDESRINNDFEILKCNRTTSYGTNAIAEEYYIISSNSKKTKGKC